MEVSVAMAIFGIFLFIVVTLTAEMRNHEKRLPINFLAHPEVNAVLARLRRDVMDTTAYPLERAGFSQTPKTLILDTIKPDGTGEAVVYDFRAPGEAHRRAFNGTTQVSDWVARGVPVFSIGGATGYSATDVGVRVTAFDLSDPTKPRLAIDEIFFPRPHS
jgi:hypothetical protein